MGAQTSYPIREPGDVGAARRAATALAAALGFDETDRGRLALVVTEAGTNVLKHGGGGEILLGRTPGGAGAEVEMIALDRGPGMRDLAKCLRDGFSTSGSPGTGLGAIMRLSSAVDIYTLQGAGTAVLARVRARHTDPVKARGRLALGVVSLPVAGESVSGDAWAAVDSSERSVILVVDGLGHGILAASAAEAAVRAFDESADEPPERLMAVLHGALRGTRGAAGAVVEVSWAERRLRFSGIGNVSAGLYTTQGSRSFVSLNGTLGAELRKAQAFDYEWGEQAVLVMHSDGLATRWELSSYPGLLSRDPSLIAGVLYRDHVRRRDDVTVVVARERPFRP